MKLVRFRCARNAAGGQRAGRPVRRGALDARRCTPRCSARMAAEGLPYGDRTMTFNSRLAQELASWAASQPGGEAIHDALFRAYFVDGKNIGDAEVLIQISRQLGLDEAQAREVIESEPTRPRSTPGKSRASTASPACRPTSSASAAWSVPSPTRRWKSWSSRKTHAARMAAGNRRAAFPPGRDSVARAPRARRCGRP